MVAVPAVPPVITPDVDIDAVPDELLLQTPPVVRSDTVTVEPEHTLIGVVGKIAVGVAYTVKLSVV